MFLRVMEEFVISCLKVLLLYYSYIIGLIRSSYGQIFTKLVKVISKLIINIGLSLVLPCGKRRPVVGL